ncbi:GntR family transcriptional regulator [Isosphaeraceae bacterium EP7]
MLFHIEAGDGRPFYAQIAAQVKYAIAAGILRPGDLVPSVREVAKQLVVNPNTVARAYRDLQVEEVLSPVRGTGLQVAADALAHCLEERIDFVRGRLRAAIDEARRSGLDAGEIDAVWREEWARYEQINRDDADAATANNQGGTRR